MEKSAESADVVSLADEQRVVEVVSSSVLKLWESSTTSRGCGRRSASGTA